MEFNEEIKISQFVMDEMSKFDSELGKHQIQVYTQIFNAGLDGIKNTSLVEAKAQLKKAKAMSQSTAEEKRSVSSTLRLPRPRSLPSSLSRSITVLPTSLWS